MKKSVCVVFLCLCLVLTMFPAAAFAAGGDYSDYEPGLYCRRIEYVNDNGVYLWVSDPDAGLESSFVCEGYGPCLREILYVDASGTATTVSYEDLQANGDYFVFERLQDDFVRVAYKNVGSGGSISCKTNGASIPITCYLPRAGFYDVPVRSEEHYLEFWEYDGSNPSIYLVAADGFTFGVVSVDDGCNVEIELDPSGKYATITLDEVTDTYIDIMYQMMIGNTPAFQDWVYIDIIDTCPGLYCRWPDLVNGEWVSDPGGELLHIIDNTIYYHMIYEFLFRDADGQLHQLRAEDLTASRPSIVLQQDDSGMITVICMSFDTGYIYYGDYKIRVTPVLPDIGFYYDSFRADEEHYITQWDPLEESAYIIPSQDDIIISEITETTANNAVFDNRGSYVEVFIDDPVEDYLDCLVKFHYAGGDTEYERYLSIMLIRNNVHYLPAISAVASADHVDILWGIVPRATKYALYRRANETGSWGNWAPLSTSLTVTNYKDTDVVPGAKYQYRAKSFSGEWSEYSNREEVTIPVPVPAAPVIAVNAAPGKNTVSWDAVDYAEDYMLYRRANESGSWTTWKVLSTQTATEYVDKATVAGAIYEYRAKATGKGGSSDYSNRIRVTALAAVAPAVPVISVSATAEKITVQWNAVSEAEKYQVFRREKSDGKWSDWELKYSAKGFVFNDKDVTGGVVYQYRAKAVDTDFTPNLKSSYSEREMIGLAKPDAPVIKVSTAVGKNTVTWNAVSGAKYYVVYWRDKASGDWSAWTMSSPVTTGTSYVHKSITSGVEYQYRVRANNGVWSEYSNKKTVIAQ